MFLPLGRAAVVIATAAACGSGEHRSTPSCCPVAPRTVAPRDVALVEPPLAWDLTEQANFERLGAAGLAPHADEQRGYFSSPSQGPNTPVVHTTEPMLIFTPRPGWTGTAHYPSPGGTLDRIELRATITPAAANAALVELEQRYGPPADRRTFPGESPSAPNTTRLVWVRGGIWLVAFASPDGNVSIAYRRDARPASSIGP